MTESESDEFFSLDLLKRYSPPGSTDLCCFLSIDRQNPSRPSVLHHLPVTPFDAECPFSCSVTLSSFFVDAWNETVPKNYPFRRLVRAQLVSTPQTRSPRYSNPNLDCSQPSPFSESACPSFRLRILQPAPSPPPHVATVHCNTPLSPQPDEASPPSPFRHCDRQPSGRHPPNTEAAFF